MPGDSISCSSYFVFSHGRESGWVSPSHQLRGRLLCLLRPGPTDFRPVDGKHVETISLQPTRIPGTHSSRNPICRPSEKWAPYLPGGGQVGNRAQRPGEMAILAGESGWEIVGLGRWATDRASRPATSREVVRGSRGEGCLKFALSLIVGFTHARFKSKPRNGQVLRRIRVGVDRRHTRIPKRRCIPS